MNYIMDIWNAIQGIATHADLITIAIAVVAVLAAGFLMDGLGSIVTMTFIALVAFGVLQYARAVLLGGANAAALADVDWHALMTMQVQLLLAYAIAFAILIAIVSLIRSLIFR
jgi:hypothetical protein